MIAATGIGLFFGCVLGLCVAPLWMMLQIPMRTCEMVQGGSMRLCAWALTLGASCAALSIDGFMPDIIGMIGLFFGGIFTGMIAAALVEAVEVIPVLSDRLSISTDLRFAAWALALGKAAGALIAVFITRGG